MRIRKRFPMSSMSSPLSDPQLSNSTLVQQTSTPLHPIQNMALQHNPYSDSQPSDPPNLPLSSDQTPVIINTTLHPHKLQIKHKEEEGEEENGSNNTRKEYNFLAVEPVGETRVLPPLSSHQVEGRWFGEDEKIPLKKRKEVVEQKGEEAVLMLKEEKKMKPNMKSKTNKKCSTSGMQQNRSEQDKASNDDSNPAPNSNVVKKMNKRGGAIMEGSRCSRVNGRGWRCCQQTLVGYSLCEHHLGKGRLRSISNVKRRTKAPTAIATTIAPHSGTTTDNTTNDNTSIDNQSAKKVSVSSSVVQSPRERKDTILLDGSCYDEDEDEDADEDEDDDDYNEEETKKPAVAKKKRMKLGMVKARSLSSLLNQTN